MFGSSVAQGKIDELEEKLEVMEGSRDSWKETAEKRFDDVKKVRFEMECMEKKCELDTERKLAELRKEMQEALITSDLKRVEAIARLEVFEKMDTKADANAIKEMIGNLISALGKQGQVQVVK